MNLFSKPNTFKRSLKILNLAATVLPAAVLPAVSNAAELEEKRDGSWVSVKGTVVSHTPSAFVLDYGDGTVTVETDDWDGTPEGWTINEGDSVTVYGAVDNNFYHKRTIEAGSIYVDDLNTLISAPAAVDEENPPPLSYTYFDVPVDYDFQVAGTVSSVSDQEFTIDTGARQVTVNTEHLDYNPLDDAGFQKIEKGDLVTVSGDLTSAVFTGPEIAAETIVWYD